MSTRWRRALSAIFLVLLLGQSGCSLILLRVPPPADDEPRQGVDCSTTAAPLVVDGLCSLVGFGYMGASIALSQEFGGSSDAGRGMIGVALTGAALGTLCAWSVVEGAKRLDRCMTAKVVEGPLPAEGGSAEPSGAPGAQPGDGTDAE